MSQYKELNNYNPRKASTHLKLREIFNLFVRCKQYVKQQTDGISDRTPIQDLKMLWDTTKHNIIKSIDYSIIELEDLEDPNKAIVIRKKLMKSSGYLKAVKEFTQKILVNPNINAELLLEMFEYSVEGFPDYEDALKTVKSNPAWDLIKLEHSDIEDKLWGSYHYNTILDFY